MLFGEFNLEDAKEVWEEEARKEGHVKGRDICLTAGPFASEYDPEAIFAATRNKI